MGCTESTEEYHAPQAPPPPPPLYIPGVRYAIHSMSSQCFIDGGYSAGQEVVMKNGDPGATQSLQWVIQPCDPGFVSIMSVTSGAFLDGRDQHTPECLVTGRPP